MINNTCLPSLLPSNPTHANNNNCYSFAAIVGQDDLKLCLILCAIDPSIGGVLIRGDKGTAKSTAARGLARLLPPIEVLYDELLDALDPYNRSAACIHSTDSNHNNNTDDANIKNHSSSRRTDKDTSDEASSVPDKESTTITSRLIPTPFVDLPIGATEDRVLGSLDFSATIQQGGRRVFAPGLLASANRGILYIDEVNLLPPHLVDVLLDAAAMGVNTVHREGITMIHPAKFMLIGTMNPEEGDLRPQLLDRFGLMVDVRAPKDPKIRAEVVRQRMAYECNPKEFRTKWETKESEIAQQIQNAKNLLPQIRQEMSEELLLLISTICSEFMIDSLRADITLYKAATALAAWNGTTEVTPDHVRQAAKWVLAHRHRQQPFGGGQDQHDQDTNKKLEQIVKDAVGTPPETENEVEGSDGQQQPQNQQQNPADGDGNDGPIPAADSNHADDLEDGPNGNVQTFTASKPQQIKQLKLGKQQKGQPGAGRRNQVKSTPQMKKGHYIRSVRTDSPVDIALDATLRAAAVNGLHPETGQPIILPDNWRRKVRHATTNTLILFVVDASGSMSARQRMEAVKGAVLALLTDAYQQRDPVGVIAFRGVRAEVLLEPTQSVELAEKQLRRLPTGGRTPLAHALSLTHATVQRLYRHDPDQAILIVLLSDGKANVPLLPDSVSPPDGGDGGSDPWAQTEQVAAKLATLDIPTLMLDTETGRVRVGRGKELAHCLNADYLPLDDLSADGLTHTIRQAFR